MAASQDGVGRAVLVLALGILALAAIPGLLSRGLAPDEKAPPGEAVPVSFQLTTFADLEGWASDDFAGVLEAFLRSCEIPAEMAENSEYLARPFGGGSHALPGGEPVAGRISDWREVCALAADVPHETDATRRFLENYFTPVAVSGAPDAAVGKSVPGQKKGQSTRTGLFTGYYEPEMTGSRTQGPEGSVPLLEKPGDLVSIDLGDFRDDLKGKRLAGRVVNGALKPYDDRASIETGKLGQAAKPVVWIDDPVDAFFLHIQGSGRVLLDTGQTLRVGYAGQNGHPYVAIGRALIERGEMTLEEVSMQAIRSWLTSHPDEAADIMRVNTSYVFFHRLEVSDPNLGPLGAGGVNLTPWRSLAVDRTFHALGVPVWLETTLPPGPIADLDDAGTETGPSFQRLMVAQDTGGAITGAVRGDVFFGWGEEATDLAGRMKQEGRMALLLPNHLAARLGRDASV